MDRNKIKKEYNVKIKNLVKLNKHYYDLNKPLVNDFSTEIIPNFINKIYTYETKGFFIDIGTPANLKKANNYF